MAVDNRILDMSEFLGEWFSSYREIVEEFTKKGPFQKLMQEIFNIVLVKLSYFLSTNRSVHIVLNPNRQKGDNNLGELHYFSRSCSTNEDCYTRVSLNHQNPIVFGINALDAEKFWQLGEKKFMNLKLVSKYRKVEHGILWDSMGECPSNFVYVVRLSCQSGNDWYNLGLALFWNDPDYPKVYGPKIYFEHLQNGIQDLQQLIIKNFETVFSKIPSMYLPEYRRRGENRVAIMFADIRNFSTVTEILRNKSCFEAVTKLINRYCDELGRVIGRYGRVDKFMGDGIMAIFGEYSNDSKETCGRALLCAKEMIEIFEKLKQSWRIDDDSAVGSCSFQSKFKKEHNESIDLHLGIGINLGEVFFDYFGKPGSEEYTAIGDHVNFAERLESKAARVINIDTGERVAPILISQTVFSHLDKSFLTSSCFEDHRPIFLDLKGLGNRFPVYHFRPDHLNSQGIELYLSNLKESKS